MIAFCSRTMTLLLIALILGGAAAAVAAGPATGDCDTARTDGCWSQEILDSCEDASSGTGCEEAETSSPAFSPTGEGQDASSEPIPVKPKLGPAGWGGFVREASALEFKEAGARTSAHTTDAVTALLECTALAVLGAGFVGVSVRVRRRPKE